MATLAKQQIVCLEDFRSKALKLLPPEVADYLEAGSGYEHTLNENRKAYSRYIILPRYLRDISNIDCSTSILGWTIPSPVCVAPTALGKLFHPEGEVAIAKACARFGAAFTMSIASTSGIEEVQAASGDGLKFFQMYWRPTRQENRDILDKVERCGFHAIMLTMDSHATLKNCRWRDKRNRFVFPPHIRVDLLASGENDSTESASSKVDCDLSLDFSPHPVVTSTTFSWDDLHWMVSESGVPIIAKGLLTAEAAKRAVDCGVSAILVSNHGGRILDGLPATIDALQNVVKAVAGRCEIYMDGGIRTGTDIFKALARGAKAVFVGRPVVHALTVNGEDGVYDMMTILRKEFKETMALTGCRNILDIVPDCVVNESFYRHSRL